MIQTARNYGPLPGLCLLAAGWIGCAGTTGAAEDEAASEAAVQAATAVVDLALGADGKCVTRSPNPRVKFNRVVRLKNVGPAPIVALVELADNFGGMPAPEGGDVAPGEFISVKLSTRWWILEEDPESREWSPAIVCKRGPWKDDSIDFDEVGRVDVFR